MNNLLNKKEIKELDLIAIKEFEENESLIIKEIEDDDDEYNENDETKYPFFININLVKDEWDQNKRIR